MRKKVDLDEAEWRNRLSDEEYRVLRLAGTELPFSGEYNLYNEKGVYHCKGCESPLFESESKFDAHCGWPSFDRAIHSGAIEEHRDFSHGMVRTEIRCATCGGHLGHIFPDGPTDTGVRFCVNSVSLAFKAR